MDEKTVFIGVRATPFELVSVKAYALAQGLSVSALIRQRIVERAVRPVLDAVKAEVLDSGDVCDPAQS